jgi:hypothetical protein
MREQGRLTAASELIDSVHCLVAYTRSSAQHCAVGYRIECIIERFVDSLL